MYIITVGYKKPLSGIKIAVKVNDRSFTGIASM